MINFSVDIFVPYSKYQTIMRAVLFSAEAWLFAHKIFHLFGYDEYVFG